MTKQTLVRRFVILAGVAIAGLALPGKASAQSRPTVSPYLNLLTTDQFGNPLPGAYQNLVRPFVEQRETNQANQAAISRLSRQVNSGARGTGGTTGNAGYAKHFMNYSHYYTGIRR